MTLTSRRKLLWLALAVCLVLVLLLLPARREPRTLDLRLAGRPQLTNGAMLLSIVLSNGTSRNLNIIDDGVGHPFVALDAGPRSNMAGTIGFGLGPLANSLKLNLAPGAVLTNALRLTNPPPRFRLLVEIRDLGWERRTAFLDLLNLLAARPRRIWPSTSNFLAYSPWIESGNSSNTDVPNAGLNH